MARRVGELLDEASAVPMSQREGAWRDAGWGGRYVGNSAVTGAPVFSDPTMLGGGVPGAEPGPDALDRERAAGTARPGVPVGADGGVDGGPALPEDELRRGRVRIYDHG